MVSLASRQILLPGDPAHRWRTMDLVVFIIGIYLKQNFAFFDGLTRFFQPPGDSVLADRLVEAKRRSSGSTLLPQRTNLPGKPWVREQANSRILEALFNLLIHRFNGLEYPLN